MYSPSGLVVGGPPEVLQLGGKLVLVHPRVLNGQLHLVQPLVRLRNSYKISGAVSQLFNESVSEAVSPGQSVDVHSKQLSKRVSWPVNSSTELEYLVTTKWDLTC